MMVLLSMRFSSSSAAPPDVLAEGGLLVETEGPEERSSPGGSLEG